MRELLVYPTHSNIREELEAYAERGIDAAPYPPRTTVDTDHIIQNCWNEQADRAEKIGFSVGKAICPTCKYRKLCLAGGYLGQLLRAKQATVALATHQRLAHNGFGDLDKDRDYVSLHEAPVDVLRPMMHLDPADLKTAGEVLHRLLSDPEWLKWFADDRIQGDAWDTIHCAKQQIRRERLYDACGDLADLIDDLAVALEAATQTQAWEPPVTTRLPDGLERLLYRVSAQMRLAYSGAPWRLLLSSLSGQLESIVIMVRERHVRGHGQGAKETFKSVVGVRCNSPPRGKVFWISDATQEADRLQALIEVPVHDATPDGQIPLQRVAMQYVRDVTRKTSPKVLAALLRAVLVERQDASCVGLITHRPLLAALALLEPEYRQRIVRYSYFGSGDERSSNVWHQDCDLIVVAGTPRIAPDGIAEYLVQIREIEAACQEPEWNTVIWHGTTESGEDIEIAGRGFLDETWRAAHRDLVRATLVQAIGRGRGILKSGCDVIVLSNEECGLTVADERLVPMGESEQQVLTRMRELTLTIPIRDSIGNMSVSTSDVAQAVGLSEQQTRRLLVSLERRGLVRRDGPRSGWHLVEPAGSPVADADPAPADQWRDECLISE
jgi:hypothetical protein